MPTTVKAPITVQIRWMIRADMPQVVPISTESFDEPWSHEDFVSYLRIQSVIGMVATSRETGDVLGYMVYQLCDNRISLWRVAVKPDYRRRGIGRQMIDKLISKLQRHKRSKLTHLVPESNLQAQLFLKALGLRYRKTVRHRNMEPDEDSLYLMSYRLPKEYK